MTTVTEELSFKPWLAMFPMQSIVCFVLPALSATSWQTAADVRNRMTAASAAIYK
jgi:hypothetical protein